MTFKAILQALEGGRLKFIDVTQNFQILTWKKVEKFARLQTLKVTRKCA